MRQTNFLLPMSFKLHRASDDGHLDLAKDLLQCGVFADNFVRVGVHSMHENVSPSKKLQFEQT